MHGFIEKESDLRIEDAIYNEKVEAGLGWMRTIRKGQSFRIIDLEGNQAVDTTFYSLDDPEDHYGAVQTIVAQKNIYLTTGSILRTESGRPILKITADNSASALAGGRMGSSLMRFCSALARALGVMAPPDGQNGSRP